LGCSAALGAQCAAALRRDSSAAIHFSPRRFCHTGTVFASDIVFLATLRFIDIVPEHGLIIHF